MGPVRYFRTVWLIALGCLLAPAARAAVPSGSGGATDSAYRETLRPLSWLEPSGASAAITAAKSGAGLSPSRPPGIQVGRGASEPSCRPTSAINLKEGVLEEGQSPWRLMRGLGLSARDIAMSGRAFRPWLQLRSLMAGHRVRVAFDEEGRVQWLQHRVGVFEAYCGVRGPKGRYTVGRDPVQVVSKLEVVAGRYRDGWVDSVEAVGEARGLGSMAAMVFPSAGLGVNEAKFRLLVEKRYVEGELLGYGPLRMIEVAAGDTVRRALRFPRPNASDAYYDEHGQPIRLARLPAPMVKAVVTSGYGKRHHPIRKRRTMHRGIDYGAPRGEPVFAVATGTVTHAGSRGQLGRLVIIEHSSGLVTRYAHLHRLARGLVKGDVIEAGDLIGLVGSSGMSTGPHLHFETIVGGRHRNPARYRPPAPPALSASALELFKAHAARVHALVTGDLVS